VLGLCRLDGEAMRNAMKTVHGASEQGLRLLAIAEGSWRGGDWPDTPSGYDFAWLGFVALADPLRAGVPEAIAQCHRAGVGIVMITGDFPGTALAIARQAGISTDG